MLSAVLNIYHASSRKNDFSRGRAHDHYYMWLFYEFHVAEDKNISA